MDYIFIFMKLEVHVHTRFSKDSLLWFWPLYIKCRLLRICLIAITDHNNIDGGIKFKEFCKRHGDHVQVIIGEEIFTSEGEIIGLYLKENIPSGLSAKETVNRIKQQNGLVYVPHPYDKKRQKTVLQETAIAENKDMIDCIEIHNGRNISSDYSSFQRLIAEKYKLNHIVGSDAHTLIEIGRNYMDINVIPNSPDEFLKVIQTAKFHQKECIRLAHEITKVIKVLKYIMAGEFNEVHRSFIRAAEKRKSRMGKKYSKGI